MIKEFTALTFDDVLIVPKFSMIESRRDVELTTFMGPYVYDLPVVSANMDTITEIEMARSMIRNGAAAALHRFCSIEDNVKMFTNVCSEERNSTPWVSIGLGPEELSRAMALQRAGARIFVVDVAHAAQIAVVNQVLSLRHILGDSGDIVVGNFATGESVKEFLKRVGTSVTAIKVGIGPGSACTTRTQTGVGYPQLSAIMDVVETLKGTGYKIVADGGMRKPGDIAKALGAGAHMCMIGGMLAGTMETSGETFTDIKVLREGDLLTKPTHKKYRGSASKESYSLQGKDAAWRTAEGESFLVPYKGPVKDVLQDIGGGLRSSMSYVGAVNLKEFHEKVEFVRISSSTVAENGAHGKRE